MPHYVASREDLQQIRAPVTKTTLHGANFWYHPQWFTKYVPDPDIEGEQLEQRLAAR